MPVCRKNLGDGTLLTSLWNLKTGEISFYFYHDYKHVVQFNLKDELEKGDHFMEIFKLLSPNVEFQKRSRILTHQTKMSMSLLLNICSLTLLFSGIFFFITYFIKRK